MNPYLYEPSGTIIHRLDPRTKLLIMAATFLLLLTPSSLPPALFSFALVAVHASLAGAWKTIYRLRMFLLIISVLTVIIWAVIPRGSQVLWLFIRRDSLIFGFLTAIKIVGILIAGMVFLVTTRNEEMMIGLVKLGVPYVACFAFSMALRLVPTFAQTGLTVVEAQRCRGLDLRGRSLWDRIKNYIPLMAPIFLVSIRNANLMAMALEARGFGALGKRSFYIQTRMRRSDWLALAITLLALLALIGFHFA